MIYLRPGTKAADIARRALLGGVCTAALLVAISPPKASAAISAIAVPQSGSGGGTLSTFSLVNNGGSTMATGTVSPQFTLAFKKGDIPAALQTTGTITANSNQLTSLASTVGIAANQMIGIAGIPGGTYVVSVNAGTSTVTMSQNATTNGTGVRAVFFGEPVLKISSTVQAISTGCHVPWSDGSLKLVSICFRSSASIAAHGSQSVTVASGGTPPTRGVRSLSDVYAQKIAVNVHGAQNSGTNITQAGLTGAIGAWIDNGSGGASVNNWRQEIYCDGDCGTFWGISTHMSTSQGGSADPALEVKHYVHALTDARGNLGGFRYLPCLRQPWYTAGATNNLRCLDIVTSPPTWQYGAGPTVTNWTWPHTSAAFTVSGGTATTNSANNYWTGTDNGSNFFMCYVTGGALPSGLVTNQMYVLNSGNINVAGASNEIVFIDFSGNRITLGNGSGTVIPVPIINPFGRFYSATSQGRYNEFQGTGSGNTGSMASLQIQMDQTYWHKIPGLIPAYNMTLKPGDWGYASIPGAYTDFSPMSIVDFTQARIGGGEPADIGPLPTGIAYHFLSQTATNDKYVRLAGLGGGQQLYDFRDSTTGNIANMNNATYAGMPATPGTQLVWDGNGNATQGFTVPTVWLAWAMPDSDGEHYRSISYYPYLLTGEPHLLDQCCEDANGRILAPTYVSSPTQPSPGGYGLIMANPSEFRILGWNLRTRVHGTIVEPLSSPDGSARWTYWHNGTANDLNWPNILLDPANKSWDIGGAATAWICNAKYFLPCAYQASVGQGPTWQLSFVRYAYLFAMALEDGSENLYVTTFLNAMVTRDNYIFNLHAAGASGWLVHAYYLAGQFLRSGTNGLPPPSSDAMVGAQATGGNLSLLSYTNRDPYISATVGNGVTMHNNDTFSFAINDSGRPTEISGATPYYVRDLVNIGGDSYTFNLAATPGGTKITISTAGNFSGFASYYQPSVQPAASTGYTAGTALSGRETCNSVCAINYGAMCWAAAEGITGGSAVMADALTRLTSTANPPNNNYSSTIVAMPTYAMQATR